MWARCRDVDDQVVGVVSGEVLLPSSCALVIKLFIVALILVLSYRATPLSYWYCAVVLSAAMSSSLLDFHQSGPLTAVWPDCGEMREFCVRLEG